MMDKFKNLDYYHMITPGLLCKLDAIAPDYHVEYGWSYVKEHNDDFGTFVCLEVDEKPITTTELMSITERLDDVITYQDMKGLDYLLFEIHWTGNEYLKGRFHELSTKYQMLRLLNEYGLPPHQ